MIDLTAAGLSAKESKCYAALLERKAWKPAELAVYVHETRTNCYKVLDNLVAYKLAERFDKDKKLHYRATNPSRLLELAREQHAAREASEEALEAESHQLVQKFYKTHEQPGVRYFQGESEIQQIFETIAKSKEEVVYVNTKSGIDFYGFPTMHNLRMLAPNHGIKRRALTADVAAAPKDYRTKDPLVLLKRTWLKESDYTTPVEWGAFDNKLYIISYGQEALGLLIESQQIADSFKELFKLLERGQKLLPDYAKLPRNAGATGQTKSRL
ncbi:MAG TPA: helix-turn-helix domain-containing protein [Candidatus Saccharimonadales bacterium]